MNRILDLGGAGRYHPEIQHAEGAESRPRILPDIHRTIMTPFLSSRLCSSSSLTHAATARLKSLVVVALLLAVAGCARSDATAAAPDFEIWAMDQGTHVIHVFDPDFVEVARIDMEAHGMRVPHMIEFTSDHRYAFVAAPATGNTAVIRTADREVVAMIATGPRTHHAAVSPDDRTVLVSVIGAADTPWDGKLVEIDVDLESERFTVGRELVIADDPVFAERRDEFVATGGAVCLAYTADGSAAYVTLGPGLDEGGVVVVDPTELRLVQVFPPGTVDANCGTLLSPTGEHMYLVGGDREVGVWHAVDTRTHEPVHRAETRGHDAHGSWVSPDGSEYWLVNRVTSNAIVVDTRTHEVLDEIEFVGKTPDIVSMSPDGRHVYITLRGPNPVTMPHVAVGETPGIAVIDRSSREMIRLVEPARGDPASDFHGIAVRPLR
jgi:DNA-binding beta-propeller fold protein YncE